MNAVTALTSPTPVKLTVDDFHLLHEAGAFAAYHKTELIDGVIVAMNAQWSAHAYVKTELAHRIATALEKMDSPLRVIVEASLALPPFGEPQPDIAITSATPSRAPLTPDTIALVIEVADTTGSFDLGRKSQIYAAGGIAEYWVVDLTKREVRCFARADGDTWLGDNTVKLGDSVASVSIIGLAIETSGFDFL